METPDTCALAVLCDSASRLTNCHRLTSGRWRCQCDPIHPERVYHVEGAAGLEACAVAAAACSDDELELGEESCDGVSADGPHGDCSTDLACGKPITLGVDTNARAWLMRFGYATCESNDHSRWLDCRCNAGEGDALVQASAESGSACRPLLEFCLSGATPHYDGETECSTESATTDEFGCRREDACTIPMQLSDDVRLGKAEPRSVDCLHTIGGGGGSDCFCHTRSSTVMLRTSEAPDDALCEAAMRSCDPEVVIEPKGAVSCQPTSTSESEMRRCDADLECTRPANLEGWDVLEKGRLVLACARSELGAPWWCSCASDQKTTRFQLGAAGVSPSEACGLAPARCIEELPVQFGPYGDFVAPPDPGP